MILVVDDDIAIQASLQLLLSEEGFEVELANRQGEALRVLNEQKVELVLMDMNFSVATTGDDGLELLAEVKRYWPHIPVVLITGWGSIDLAVAGMRGGAFDFITKPWSNSRMLRTVTNALALSEQKCDAKITREQLDRKYDFTGIIGREPSLLSVLKTIGRVASTTATVLVQGESGTGKELIARAVHENSKRKEAPFVSVNLGAIPDTLFESEMFGYKKGAFTDAKEDKLGKFQLANGGTIFLDEIGEMSLNSQVKLLRVLQEQQLENVGGTRPIDIDVRVVCATNRNLAKMVEDGQFREDLYYRINLININLPPLRDRSKDIPLLASMFLDQIVEQYDLATLQFDESALQLLKKQRFLGNIRELKNLIERVALNVDSEVIMPHQLEQMLSVSVSARNNSSLPEVGAMTLEEMERQMIERALEKFNGNVSKAADSLGLSRQMLYRRIEKYNLRKALTD